MLGYMYTVVTLCRDYDPKTDKILTPYIDKKDALKLFHVKEDALKYALEEAEKDVDFLNDGCDAEANFGAVEGYQHDVAVAVVCYFDEHGRHEWVNKRYILEVNN